MITLPAEIICKILSFTSPMDVVRWRSVSKWFCDLTHEPMIWRILYANEPYVRPPGPFTTLVFERAFVKSAKLAKTWPARGLQTLTRVKVPFKGEANRNIDLIGGRWFFVCQAKRRFVLYDTSVEAETREPRVVWEQDERIICWNKRLATSEQGKWVVYVLMNTKGHRQTTLLEIQLDAATGALSGTASFRLPVLAQDPKLDCSRQEWGPCSRFFALRDQALVFDRRTRAFYEFPEFRIALPATRFVIGPTDHGHALQHIIPTNTHVILLHRFNRKGKKYVVIQAFVVPDDRRPTENGRGILRLTHEGIFKYLKVIFALIRNSVVDPATGVVSVKLLERHSQWMDEHLKSVCISLTLESTSEDVSPISVRRDPVLIRRAGLFSLHKLDFCGAYYDVSQDGYARGLFTQCGRCTGTRRGCVMKFSIDASGDQCVLVVGPLSSEGEAKGILPLVECTKKMVLDSVGGRLSYLGDGDEKGASICVVDIK